LFAEPEALFRYLIVLFFQPKKQSSKLETKKKEEDLREMQRRHGIVPDNTS